MKVTPPLPGCSLKGLSHPYFQLMSRSENAAKGRTVFQGAGSMQIFAMGIDVDSAAADIAASTGSVTAAAINSI